MTERRNLVSMLERLLPGGRLGRGAATLALGTAVAHLILLLGVPLLTRLYTPADFGLAALVTAFVSTVVVAVAAGYDTAIVGIHDPDEAATLTAAALGLTLVLTPVAVLGLVGLRYYSIGGYGGLPWWVVPVAWVSVGLTAAHGILRYWNVRSGRFAPISRSVILQAIARVAGQGGLAPVLPGAQALIAGEALGRAVGVRMLAGEGAEPLWGRFRWEAWPAVRAVLYRHRRFPAIVLPSSVLNTLAATLPVPLLAGLFGAQAAGWFALVQRVLAAPATLIGASVADAFHWRAAEQVRRDPAGIRPLFLRTAGRLFLVALLPAAVIGLFGPRIFEVVFGSSWREAGVLAALLSPWALAQLTVSPVSRLVLVTGGQHLKLLYDLASLLGGLGALVGAHLAGRPVTTAVAWWSGAQVASYVAYFVVLLRLSDGSAHRQ